MLMRFDRERGLYIPDSVPDAKAKPNWPPRFDVPEDMKNPRIGEPSGSDRGTVASCGWWTPTLPKPHGGV